MSTENVTRDDLAEMDDDELEAWKQQQKDRLDSAIEEEQQELNEQQQNAVSILKDDAEDRDELAEVEVGDATLFVTTSISGRLEDRFNRLSENPEEIDGQREVLIDAILELLQDADEAGFLERETWQAIHTEYGTQYLAEVFAELAEPAIERVESVKSFRQK